MSLFGGLAHAGEKLLQPVRESLDRNLLSIWRGQIKVLMSELPGDDAALLGAAALVWDKRK